MQILSFKIKSDSVYKKTKIDIELKTKDGIALSLCCGMLIQITGVYISVVYAVLLVSVNVGYLIEDKTLFQCSSSLYWDQSLKTNRIIECTMSRMNAAQQTKWTC